MKNKKWYISKRNQSKEMTNITGSHNLPTTPEKRDLITTNTSQNSNKFSKNKNSKSISRKSIDSMNLLYFSFFVQT
jgi:hypothetical protein